MDGLLAGSFCMGVCDIRRLLRLLAFRRWMVVGSVKKT